MKELKLKYRKEWIIDGAKQGVVHSFITLSL